MPKKVFVSTVVFLTDDEERTQRYVVSEGSELEAEKALRRYLNDRDEKIISVRLSEPTGSETAYDILRHCGVGVSASATICPASQAEQTARPEARLRPHLN